MLLRLVGRHKLRFDDESEFQFTGPWEQALNYKLLHEKLTLPKFLLILDKNLQERLASQTASSRSYASLAELAKDELHQFLNL